MKGTINKRCNIIVPLLRDCDRPVEVSNLMNDAALLIDDLHDSLYKYGCTIASIYSLVKPLSETNGVCGAVAECIENYAPKAVENSQIKGIKNV